MATSQSLRSLTASAAETNPILETTIVWTGVMGRASGARVNDLRHRVGGLVLTRPPIILWTPAVVLSLIWMGLAPGHDHHALIVLFSVGVAAFISSVAGFAFSAICGAILFHVGDDPVTVVQIMITCSIANQAAMTWQMRRIIDWRLLGLYLAGGMVGLPVGIWILTHLDRASYTHVFGAFLLVYGTILLLTRPVVVRFQPRVADFAAGFLGGITGGAAGFPGAFATIWCGTKGWDKARQRALVQPFILVMQIMALLLISLVRGAAGARGFDPATLLFIPASLVATYAGLSLFKRLTDRQFARIVNVMLIVSGLGYVL